MAVGTLLAYAVETLAGGEPHDHLHCDDQVSSIEQPKSATASQMNQMPGHVMHSQGQIVHPQGQMMYPQSQMMYPQSQMSMAPGGVMAVGNAFGADEAVASDVESGAKAIKSSRLTVESIEFGCVAHSVVLGLTLGLQTDLDGAITLLIVFLLHQALEAICLSHLIASLENRFEAIIMCVLTTSSMPIGITIGIIVSYSANSTKNADTMGPITSSIACIAGGMLLYSSLVNIIAEDVKRPSVVNNIALKRAMTFCLVLGASAMSALAAGEVANGGHAHR